MKRLDGRLFNQLRKIDILKDYVKHAEGSCLISFGDTRVICTASVEEGVPPFLKGSGKGWVTAEYGMLPRSCNTRIRRNETSGRVQEIQRLIGRSLRAVVDMSRLGERTVKIDCDVIQADGGTRTASITGGFVALVLAFKRLQKEGSLPVVPISDYVAAVSVGIVDGKRMLDLNYGEDSNAEMDMNVVMVGQGLFIEIQGTAEKRPFAQNDWDALLNLARKGIKELLLIQKKHLGKGLVLDA